MYEVEKEVEENNTKEKVNTERMLTFDFAMGGVFVVLLIELAILLVVSGGAVYFEPSLSRSTESRLTMPRWGAGTASLSEVCDCFKNNEQLKWKF